MADITKVKMGSVDVEINGTDIGHTVGGAELHYEPTYADITVDKYGETPANKVLVGEKWTATVRIAESTLANLKRAIPRGVNTVATKLTIGSVAGKLLSENAFRMVLHPTTNASGDKTEDVIFYKAVSTEPVEIPYHVDETKVVEVTFHALIDESKSDGNLLGLIGDSTT